MAKIFFLVVAFFFTTIAFAGNSHEFKLRGRSVVDQEILSAEVFNYYQILGGMIHISWHQNNANILAEELKKKLVATGILPVDIVMDKQMTYKTGADIGLVNVKIETYKNIYPCDYQRQYYSFKNTDPVGCAIDNNLYSSLLNKNKKVF